MQVKTTLAASVIAAIGLAPSAQAADPTLCERAWNLRAEVKERHGDAAPGRNICRYGVVSKFNREWDKPATTRQKARYVRQLRRLLRPAPRLLVRTAAPPAQRPAGTLTASAKAPAGGTLSSIAACESGGNPRAVDPSGTYRGKYQFDMQTWRSVGGSGDPAAASEAVQDQMAARLYAQRGAAPWPVCGR